MKNRLLAGMLVVMMTVMSVDITSYAGEVEDVIEEELSIDNCRLIADTVPCDASEPKAGKIEGTDIRWSWDGVDTLIIEGIGAIPEERLVKGDNGWDYYEPYWGNDIADSVKNVEIKEGITGIGYRSFCENKALESVRLPDSLNEIGDLAFSECYNLSMVEIPGHVNTIGIDSFFGIAVNEINIPNSVTSIGNAAFAYCRNLEKVTLSENLSEIGDSVFAYCESLQSIVIPDNVTIIHEWAFYGCNSLTNIQLSNNLEEIEQYAFYGVSVSDIQLPKTLKALGNAVIYSNKLKSIYIPASVETIGHSAVIGNNLSIITVDPDNRHFDSRNNCNGIIETETDGLILACSNTVIPNSVKTLAGGSCAYAFTETKTSFYIPRSIKYILYEAFKCTLDDKCKLTDVFYEGTEEEWGNIDIYYRNEELDNAIIHFNAKESDISDIPDKPAEKKDEIKYTEYNEHYYAVIDEEMNWEDAEAYCESLGGYLVTISDEKENAFSYGLLKKAGYKNGWIGLKATSGSFDPIVSPTGETDSFLWKWVTGDFANNYSNWADGEGKAQNGEKYGMFFESYTDGKWNDWGNYDSTFICEWDFNPNSISDDEKREQIKTWKSLLKEKASSYNHDLALRAVDLSEIAEDEKGLNIRKKYIQLGADNTDIMVDGYGDSFAYSIAGIHLDKEDLLIITTRGTTTIGEALGDKYPGYSQDTIFNRYSNNVYRNAYEYEEKVWSGMNKFLDDHPSFNNSNSIKVLIAGHSLGGASANLVAARMDILLNRGEFWADVLDTDKVYAYTFGAIDSITERNVYEGFENIHNIFNYYDTYGPNAQGQKIAGISGNKPAGASSYGRFGNNERFQYDFSKEDGQSDEDTVWNHLPNQYKRAIENRLEMTNSVLDYINYGVLCPVDVTIRYNGEIVGLIKDNVIDKSVTSIPMIVYDDHKSFLVPKDNNYSVSLKATDSGEMDYYAESFETEIGEIKVFNNIELKKDKEFVCDTAIHVSIDDYKLYVADKDGNIDKEVLADGKEINTDDYGDVLESDFPTDGTIPDGIWIVGVTDMAYTGKALTQEFRVYDGTTMLAPKTDYTVKYKNNKKTYTISDPDNLTADDKKKAPQIFINMKGNYSGKETVYFSINPTGENPAKIDTKPYAITGDKIKITDEIGNSALSAVYNKAGAKPSIRVMYEDTVLKEGRDYTLKYSGNTKYPATKASVTVTGKGNYTSKKTIPITITQRPFSKESGITVVASDKAEGKKAGQYATTVKVFDSEGKLLKAGTDYDNKITYLKDGVELTKEDYPKAGDTITVRVTGKGGYTNDFIDTTYSIVSVGQVNDISKATIKIKDQSYNKGKPITITSQDMFDQAFISKSKTPLKLSTDGGATGDIMVVPGSYVKNTTKGTAKVTFMGINGKTGTKTVSFKIGARSLKDIWFGWIK